MANQNPSILAYTPNSNENNAGNLIKQFLDPSSLSNTLSILKRLIDNIPVIVTVYNNTSYLYVNSTFVKVLGYTLEEALKMSFWHAVHPDHQDMAKARGLARIRGEKVPTNYEFKAVKKNGEVVWLNLFLTLMNIGNENVAISGCIDITESKRLKKQLLDYQEDLEVRVKQRTKELHIINQKLLVTNQNLNNVLHNMPYGVITLNRSGDFKILTPLFKDSSERSSVEIEFQLQKMFLGKKVPFIEKMFNSNQLFRDEELRVTGPHGSYLFLTSGTPILDENGVVKEGVIILRPIKEVRGFVARYSGFRATFNFEDIVTKDRTMLNAIREARKAAKTFSNVLIQGETGTGKELFAQAIHNESSRRKGPFLAVNCGAIPRELIGTELFGFSEGSFTGARKGGSPGKFEIADGGTIFLDEISELPLEQQPVLLRAVQERAICRIGENSVRPIDIRIICATNKDLVMEMRKGNFRQDLFYRINVINIKIPPLRERPADVLLLFDYFLKTLAPQFKKTIEKVSDDVSQMIVKYHWPGNVREMQNVVERILNTISGTSLEARHIGSEIMSCESSISSFTPDSKNSYSTISINEARELDRRMKADLEKEEIMKFLKIYHGNISKVAKKIGISRTTLYKKMKIYSCRHPWQPKNSN